MTWTWESSLEGMSLYPTSILPTKTFVHSYDGFLSEPLLPEPSAIENPYQPLASEYKIIHQTVDPVSSFRPKGSLQISTRARYLLDIHSTFDIFGTVKVTTFFPFFRYA